MEKDDHQAEDPDVLKLPSGFCLEIYECWDFYNICYKRSATKDIDSVYLGEDLDSILKGGVPPVHPDGAGEYTLAVTTIWFEHRPKYAGSEFLFESLQDAREAMQLAYQVIMKAGSDCFPPWARQALAAGWSPPKIDHTEPVTETVSRASFKERIDPDTGESLYDQR